MNWYFPQKNSFNILYNELISDRLLNLKKIGSGNGGINNSTPLYSYTRNHNIFSTFNIIV